MFVFSQAIRRRVTYRAATHDFLHCLPLVRVHPTLSISDTKSMLPRKQVLEAVRLHHKSNVVPNSGLITLSQSLAVKPLMDFSRALILASALQDLYQLTPCKCNETIFKIPIFTHSFAMTNQPSTCVGTSKQQMSELDVCINTKSKNNPLLQENRGN